MRQKDFDEVAVVIGNEVRLCDSHETAGLVTAFEAVLGHAQHRYPDVDTAQTRRRFDTAVQYGWDAPPRMPTSLEDLRIEHGPNGAVTTHLTAVSDDGETVEYEQRIEHGVTAPTSVQVRWAR